MTPRPRAVLISQDSPESRQAASLLEGGFDLTLLTADETALSLAARTAPDLILHEYAWQQLELLQAQTTQLKKLRDFQRAASRLSASLIAAADEVALDLVINECLALIGNLLDADRAYVFVHSEDGTLITNSHEWCAQNVQSTKDRITNLPIEPFDWLHQTIIHKGMAAFYDLSELPDEAAYLRAECAAQSIQSFVMAPMRGAQGALIGMLGLDQVHQHKRWTQDELAMLRILAGIIGTAIEQQRARKTLTQLSAYRELISRLSLSFINLPLEQLNEAINKGLALIGQFFEVDRAYVFDYDFIHGTTSNTYEWCAPGVKSEITHLQKLPVELSPEWLEQHQQGCAFYVEDVSALPPSPLRDVLMPQQISSLVTVPLMNRNQCLGYVGLDVVVGRPGHVGQKELSLLQLFAELLVNVFGRQQTDNALRQAASVFEHANEGIMITNTVGVIIDVNSAFCRLTGHPRKTLIGTDPRSLYSEGPGHSFHVRMCQSLEQDGAWSGELWNRRPNGERYAVQMTTSAIRDKAGHIQSYVTLFSDITGQKTHEAELEHLAHYDSLTGLANRTLLADRLTLAMTQAIRRGLLIAVAYIDLDGFKEINDCHGHHSGDLLLMSVAEKMQKVLRKGDTLARLGGDEFVALLVDLPALETALPLLRRLLNAACEPVENHHCVMQVSASLGISFYPGQAEVSPEQLLRQADEAMYVAKMQGKNRYHIHRDIP